MAGNSDVFKGTVSKHTGAVDASRIGDPKITQEEFGGLSRGDQIAHMQKIYPQVTQRIGTPYITADEFASLTPRQQNTHLEGLSIAGSNPRLTISGETPSSPSRRTSGDAAIPAVAGYRNRRAAVKEDVVIGNAAESAGPSDKHLAAEQKQLISDKISVARAGVEGSGEPASFKQTGTTEAIAALTAAHAAIRQHISDRVGIANREIAHHVTQARTLGAVIGKPHAAHVKNLVDALELTNNGRTSGGRPDVSGNDLVEADSYLSAAKKANANSNTDLAASHIRRAASHLTRELTRLSRTPLGKLGVLPSGVSKQGITQVADNLGDMGVVKNDYGSVQEDHPQGGLSKPGHVWIGNPRARAGSPAALRQYALSDTADKDWLAAHPEASKQHQDYLKIRKYMKEAQTGRTINEDAMRGGWSSGETSGKPSRSRFNSGEMASEPVSVSSNKPVKIPFEEQVTADGKPAYRRVNGTLVRVGIPVETERGRATAVPSNSAADVKPAISGTREERRAQVMERLGRTKPGMTDAQKAAYDEYNAQVSAPSARERNAEEAKPKPKRTRKPKGRNV